MAILVQRGTFSIASGTTPDGGSPAPSGGKITLPTSVTNGKAIARVTVRSASGTTARDVLCTAELTDEVGGKWTTLSISRHQTGTTVNGTWEVIEHTDWDVEPFSIAIADTTTSNTATISSTTTTQAFIVCGWRSSENHMDRAQPRVRFTSSTVVTADRVGSSGTVDVYGYVVRWSTATVEHKDITMTSTGSDDLGTTINSVTLANAWVEHTWKADNNAGRAARTFVEAEITTTTNLQLRRGSISGTCTVAAQIISHPDVTVQVDNASMADTVGSYTTPALGTAVTMNQAFIAAPLMGNGRSASDDVDTQDDAYHTQELTGTTQVTGTRAGTTNAHNATYQVVEFTPTAAGTQAYRRFSLNIS